MKPLREACSGNFRCHLCDHSPGRARRLRLQDAAAPVLGQTARGRGVLQVWKKRHAPAADIPRIGISRRGGKGFSPRKAASPRRGRATSPQHCCAHGGLAPNIKCRPPPMNRRRGAPFATDYGLTSRVREVAPDLAPERKVRRPAPQRQAAREARRALSVERIYPPPRPSESAAAAPPPAGFSSSPPCRGGPPRLAVSCRAPPLTPRRPTTRRATPRRRAAPRARGRRRTRPASAAPRTGTSGS